MRLKPTPKRASWAGSMTLAPISEMGRLESCDNRCCTLSACHLWLMRVIWTRLRHGAHKQLEGLAVACLTERFAESVALVCELLGIELPKKLPEKNIGPRKTGVLTENYRATMPLDLVARIEATNRHDQELYAHACELFEIQLARHRKRRRRTISIAPGLRSRLPFAIQLSEHARRAVAVFRPHTPR
jgi:hypothetical protein